MVESIWSFEYLLKPAWPMCDTGLSCFNHLVRFWLSTYTPYFLAMPAYQKIFLLNQNCLREMKKHSWATNPTILVGWGTYLLWPPFSFNKQWWPSWYNNTWCPHLASIPDTWSSYFVTDAFFSFECESNRRDTISVVNISKMHHCCWPCLSKAYEQS